MGPNLIDLPVGDNGHAAPRPELQESQSTGYPSAPRDPTRTSDGPVWRNRVYGARFARRFLMAELVQIGGHRKGFGATTREDPWWIGPALTVAVLGGFIVYATWALLQGEHYFIGASEGFGG